MHPTLWTRSHGMAMFSIIAFAWYRCYSTHSWNPRVFSIGDRSLATGVISVPWYATVWQTSIKQCHTLINLLSVAHVSIIMSHPFNQTKSFWRCHIVNRIKFYGVDYCKYRIHGQGTRHPSHLDDAFSCYQKLWNWSWFRVNYSNQRIVFINLTKIETLAWEQVSWDGKLSGHHH